MGIRSATFFSKKIVKLLSGINTYILSHVLLVTSCYVLLCLVMFYLVISCYMYM